MPVPVLCRRTCRPCQFSVVRNVCYPKQYILTVAPAPGPLRLTRKSAPHNNPSPRAHPPTASNIVPTPPAPAPTHAPAPTLSGVPSPAAVPAAALVPVPAPIPTVHDPAPTAAPTATTSTADTLAPSPAPAPLHTQTTATAIGGSSVVDQLRAMHAIAPS